ncbi:unnamed protein product [Leptosia nina]|uniref:Prisilkin-39 n=1 Tax=Leptosia nina TaxID=320188 RepID=A0AAV1JZ44_9NEOP
MELKNMKYLIIFLSFVSKFNADAKPTKTTRDLVDLQTAGSSYSHQYYDWGGSNPGGYNFGVTGNGILEDPRRYPQNGYYPGQDEKLVEGGYRSLGGYGGYGGYGGNGGLESYYGYNNPYYQDSNHLGFGYYKRFGIGNIYGSGVTPNLVTGYRGYSRR